MGEIYKMRYLTGSLQYIAEAASPCASRIRCYTLFNGAEESIVDSLESLDMDRDQNSEVKKVYSPYFRWKQPE